MFSIVPDLYAMSPQSGGGNPGMMGQFVLFGAIFLIFFLLVIRPQQKKAKKHREMVSSIQKGDKVITSSGIYGKINKYFDDKDYMLLEIADKTIIKIQKNQISDVVKSSPQKQVADKSEDKTEEKS
ncbi:MAG: preprotein translocase subunit YajC [Deltaproteobacteria bacterium]|jgi:preprotein translocase subunit YajC|nr:preprotein translocase subunit YajC [Deltaproteobacteria bacterium]MBT4641844.1 preprotein translocase subunit YajC [Deltaproteobacteria bacterium]MBT6504585.1 preprotein translocase subunit YajC [Deltaproteobacteria bacterium]MBT6611254.1 preprotein translocase subunit YajC [Deltaproteobacteria bacterium]MBT7151202.1 preprotein translocase subunit YajC [Deltaproteobacteria bacterium]